MRDDFKPMKAEKLPLLSNEEKKEQKKLGFPDEKK